MIRRGIVIVHGVGNQQRGDELDDVIEPLVEFLGARAVGHANVHVVARNPRSGDTGASARIHLYRPGATPAQEILEEWDVREAWWAHVFRPSGGAGILAWAMRALVAHIHSTIENILWRNIVRVFGGWPAVQGTGVWQVPVAGAYPYYVLDAIGWLLITIGYLVVYSIGVALAFVVYVFLLLPGLQYWPPAGNLQRSLLNIFTGGIGEQQATTNRHVAVAEAASVVTQALCPFLDPQSRDRDGLGYESVTVIAHSGGCVVSFEALTGEEVRRLCGEDRLGRRFVTLVTLGSGLNLAWRMRAARKAKDLAFWNRPISDHVNWINIYARYDPVPQGEPPDGMVRTLTGAGVAEQPWLAVRVANDDWPLTDHGAYWQNDAEVNARLVHAIVDPRLARQPIAELGGSYDRVDPDPLHLEGVVCREVRDGAPQHRRHVTLESTRRLGIGGVILLLLAIFHAAVSDLGGRLLQLTGWGWPTTGITGWLAAHTPLALLTRPAAGNWLVGAAIVIYAAIILGLLVGLAIQFVSWFLPEQDVPWPPEEQEC
jgi:hypothetical protein